MMGWMDEGGGEGILILHASTVSNGTTSTPTSTRPRPEWMRG